jgi:hypothetical protein
MVPVIVIGLARHDLGAVSAQVITWWRLHRRLHGSRSTVRFAAKLPQVELAASTRYRKNTIHSMQSGLILALPLVRIGQRMRVELGGRRVIARRLAELVTAETD